MTEWISWFATAATVTAALITASNLGARITGYGFVVFLFGSLAWFATGLLTGQPALMWTNALLCLLNIWGIWRWLGRQAQLEEGGKTAQAVSEDSPGEALFPASLLTHAPLIGSAGSEIGRSVDAMIGCHSGRIHYVVASTGGVAGVGEQLHRWSWAGLRVEEDAMRLPITAEDFGRLQAIARDEWPDR